MGAAKTRQGCTGCLKRQGKPYREEPLETFVNISFAMLRMAAPLILAAMGGVFSQQVGLINIALEGLMLVGAFAAVLAAFYLHSALAGVLVAILVAVLFALLFAFFILHLRADLIVVGLAVNILALGLTKYLLQVLFATRGAFAPKDLPGLLPMDIPGLDAIPLLGDILSGHNPLVYISWLLIFVTQIFLYRTVTGLHIRAVGEKRDAAESVGIPVARIQYLGLALSGAFCGLAGAQLSLGNLQLFSENMTNGRGFMALAAVFFGQGRPLPSAFACLLFGFFEALQIRLQTRVGMPPQWPQMLPFMIIVVTLIFISVRQARHRA